MERVTPVTARGVSLRRSLRIQARVVRALVLREVITRFGRHNVGVLWLIAEPMLFTLGVSALWSTRGIQHTSVIPIVAFAITGYSSVLMWRNTVGHCVFAIQSNFNLLYHRNVTVLDVFLARIAIEVCGASGSLIALSAFFAAIEWIEPPVDPLMAACGWLMLGWFGASLALLIGAATAYGEIVKRLWGPISYLLFPLSGAAFMVDWLPPAGQKFILLLPMVHGVEMLREGYFGNAVRTHYDVAYMASINLLLLFCGLALLRDAAGRIEVA